MPKAIRVVFENLPNGVTFCPKARHRLYREVAAAAGFCAEEVEDLATDRRYGIVGRDGAERIGRIFVQVRWPTNNSQSARDAAHRAVESFLLHHKLEEDFEVEIVNVAEGARYRRGIDRREGG